MPSTNGLYKDPRAATGPKTHEKVMRLSLKNGDIFALPMHLIDDNNTIVFLRLRLIFTTDLMDESNQPDSPLLVNPCTSSDSPGESSKPTPLPLFCRIALPSTRPRFPPPLKQPSPGCRPPPAAPCALIARSSCNGPDISAEIHTSPSSRQRVPPTAVAPLSQTRLPRQPLSLPPLHLHLPSIQHSDPDTHPPGRARRGRSL